MTTKSTPDPAPNEDVEVIPPTSTPDPDLTSTPNDPSFIAQISEEYGQYRAAHLLLIGGVPAFASGAPVPASHPMAETWLAEGSITRVQG